MSRSAIAVVSVCVLWGAAPARANTLDVPRVVVADKTGAFSYKAVFTVKDPVILAGAGVEWTPEDNIVGQPWHGDCLCHVPGCDYDAGEEIVLSVYGSLRNPSENGTVRVWFAFCYTESFYATTTVLPWTLTETVPVGNPGNAPDTRYETPGYGGVDYVYNIGKTEVTAGQYAEFLNAVADDDTYGLYNPRMGITDPSRGCNIQRSGSSGSYTYSVAGDWADRPVNHVSWGSAARFSNWLYNGQPTGAQDLSTTEDGSYDLSATHEYYGPEGQVIDRDGLDAALTAVVREPDATWVIPSEDEWYKAAYHKNDGVTGNYFDYPTSSDSVPSNDLIDPDPGSNATFNDAVGSEPPGYTIGSPYYRTEVGAHENSESPYATFDQGGNVWEWNEAVNGAFRGLRGGSFHTRGLHLRATGRYGSGSPSYGASNFGFRVSEVPVLDLTGDGTVDLRDFALLQAGFGGDVDLYHFVWFQTNFTGPLPSP